MSQEKQTLRTQARKARASIDRASESPDAAADLFFSAIKPKPEQIIAGYYPVGREFDALILLERAIAQGFTCALPIIQPETRILKFKTWDQKSSMTPNKHGVPEPTDGEAIEPDIIIVPLLAFDRRGTRLGQGGGYYDATLAHLRAKKDIIAVGMGYSQQAVLFNLPREDHDEPLDWMITPKATHYFTP